MEQDIVLTYGLLKKRLQIANCCASKMGIDVIEKQKKGFDCTEDNNKIQLMLDLVDSICIYIDNSAVQTDPFDDTDTCLETNEIKSILSKLCSLCDRPCTDVLNFQ